jgi:hypothetical protein
MKHIKEGVSQLYTHKDALIPALLFFLNLFLVYAVFLPNLSDLNPWDEAGYLHAGQVMIDGGRFPALGGNPLTVLFFGLTYLPFKASTYWMVYSASLAKALLFILLWLGTYLVASRLSKFAPTVIALGIFFVTPLAIEMLRFPSDPLFAAMAALSLWQLLKYKASTNHRHLILASFFMGMAAMARNDGLVLFVILVLLSLMISLQRKVWWRSLLSSLLPFSILIGGYILVYGLATGDYRLGTMERTYENFESGQQVNYSGDGEFNAVIESRLEARRLFGTPEENQYSIFNAIKRNPQEYLRRLTALVKVLPQIILLAYGIRFAVPLFLFAGRGIIELLRRKEYAIAIILCLWPAHLLTGFAITLFRQGHLQFPFYVVFGLAAIGLAALLSNLEARSERSWVTILLLAFCLYGIIDNKLAIFYGAAIILLSIWVIYLSFFREGQFLTAIPLLILLMAGIVIRGNFPSPVIRAIGTDPKEQCVKYLVEHFEPGTAVAAASPGVVWAAKMSNAGLSSADVPRGRTPDEFFRWLEDQGVEAIYVDNELYNGLPGIWKFIEPLIGKNYERVFQVEQGNYQILFMRP